MAIVFSPFVKEILEYAWSIAQLYDHKWVAPSHVMLAILKHHSHGYIRSYIEQKMHLISFKQQLLNDLQTLETPTHTATLLSESSFVLEASMEGVLKDAYSEAATYQSDIILPEYFFLSLLKHYTFEPLRYDEAKDFIKNKVMILASQHQEINWSRQDIWLQLTKRLDKMYEGGSIALKPYLHQAYQASTGRIRSFILLVEPISKNHKISIELIESTYLQPTIEQTLRFLNHRKYPIEEVFLYQYDLDIWQKITVLPKEIIVSQHENHYSSLLTTDLHALLS